MINVETRTTFIKFSNSVQRKNLKYEATVGPYLAYNIVTNDFNKDILRILLVIHRLF